ncbi:MAG: phosphoesterase, partial [Candidatus Woesearchaeota archaeon]|nr:phosphoesterase [Candidatus Woesearchaeota archaeon]
NGDLKHEFSTISDQEWRHTLKLLDFFEKHCNEIILIKGNHDTILGPIAKKRNIRVMDHFIINNILIIHGDVIPSKTLLKGVKTIIIGHEHPAVSVREGPRAELFKAFLVGKWKKYNLVVQPSFNLVTEGTDVLKEEVLSPFLKGNLRNLNAIIVGDKLYNFGKIKDLN